MLFRILTAVTVKCTGILDIRPNSLVEIDYFREMYSLNFQDQRGNQVSQHQEASRAQLLLPDGLLRLLIDLDGADSIFCQNIGQFYHHFNIFQRMLIFKFNLHFPCVFTG
jgi:hypothetical protein